MLPSGNISDGDNITLWCNVTSKSDTTQFTWRRAGEVVTDEVTSGINWSRLVLLPATCLDSDLYSCEADNGVYSKFFSLILVGALPTAKIN